MNKCRTFIKRLFHIYCYPLYFQSGGLHNWFSHVEPNSHSWNKLKFVKTHYIPLGLIALLFRMSIYGFFRNYFELSFLVMSCFGFNIEVMLPSSKKLRSVLFSMRVYVKLGLFLSLMFRRTHWWTIWTWNALCGKMFNY